MIAGRRVDAATIVNCIGEQTTITGDGGILPSQLWPQQLGMLLGGTYTVNNVGVNTGTVFSGAALSAASLKGPPNIVIIGPFAEHDYAPGITEAMWQAAYKKLVDAYLALTPVPTVYVMTPPPAAFIYQSAAEQTFATNVVKPAVLAVAAGDNSAAKVLKVIDLFADAVLATAPDQATPPDGHFSVAGHHEAAQVAYKCVAMDICGAGTSTGAGGTGGTAGVGGAGSASGAGGAAGTGSGGSGGVTGSAGTSGTAGAGGATTGAAGTGATSTGGAGNGGTTTGTAGTGATPTGGAGTVGTAAGTAGTSPPAHSSGGGGCMVADSCAANGLATLLMAMALAVRASRRRRS
ncbi:MAG TPA: hypothetical protein VMT47_00565 [Polyangia bacterium]|nr:hypothetical protein [Polyangia bacterium]